jgi:hypothetical protein
VVTHARRESRDWLHGCSNSDRPLADIPQANILTLYFSIETARNKTDGHSASIALISNDLIA